MRGRGVCVFVFVCVLCASSLSSTGAETMNLAAKCNVLVQKVIPCMNYATGQVAVPTKGCCEATSEIKRSNPECLCFAIQQTHKGTPEVKSMGIQEARLLQLPSACNLKNASTTNCPKLLGLSPNSPDAAMFRNGSLSSNSSSSRVGGAPRSAVSESESQKASYGNMVRPAVMTMSDSDLIAVGWALLVFLLPGLNL
ncbi:hypothetical protein Fmac_004749 [Flemingia macrophylla]|uniref:Bifunctional inhibitor/plant lipid transfer protein/seed storage helical domain-containing protein n=1 Tax=Flemingia macrophylla TaxID=520843 RepID=A0ABD1N5T2_9FABA